MEIQDSTTTDPTTDADATQKYYEGMTAVRRRIVRPLVITTLAAFFLQQVLTNFTSVLDGFATDGLSWAYLYAFALFFLVVVLTTVYKRAMDKVEDDLRPAHLDETAAHYEDWTEWEKHEAELAHEEQPRAESPAHGSVDETPTRHDKETRP
jgi:uncharacterized membrane protein (DUF485 family)